MEKNLIFIHGMFQNPKSWKTWINYFVQKGYNCFAPAWPYHEGEPKDLRDNIPQELGQLRLKEIINEFVKVISGLASKPVLIGHSVGGLIVQSLINKGLGEMGIAISSVAPNQLMTLDLNKLNNVAAVINPLKGNSPSYMTPAAFHGSFANTLSKDNSDKSYEAYATHESRNVLRDCMKEYGRVDFDKPHAPLLFIGAQNDKIIPPSLVCKNANAYSDPNSLINYIEYSNRSHFICNEPGWDEVAAFSYNWIETVYAKTYAHIER
jgi:alpha-beta hydrolase superfamily lysophospholipase